MLSWWIGSSSAQAQTTFTIGSNLPAVFATTISIDTLYPTNIADSSTVTTSVSGGTPNFSYSWEPATLFGDPSLATARVKFNDITSVQEVWVTATDSRGCIARDTMKVNYSLPITEYNSLDIQMNIIPNPNTGIFSVSLEGKPSGSEMEMVVLDAVGRLVYTERLARFQGSLNKELDLSQLSKGAYFLGFYSEGKQVFKKLMIH